MKPSVMKPKFDINIRHSRELGVARVTFLKGNKRHGQYLFCDSEQVSTTRGMPQIQSWMARNKRRGISFPRAVQLKLAKAA
jgi:hypothetical protein